MKEVLNIGIIGMGNRGAFLTRDALVMIGNLNISAVCDVYMDRCEENAKMIEAAGRPRPFVTDDYHDILSRDDVDAVLITSSWESHIDITCDAMKAGKMVGFEVGGCYAVEDCWKLIRTYEETGVPCSLLENCCFGRNELLVLNMIRKGIFGEIVHCAGGYRHDLREEITRGRENRHYRFRNYLNRCCDNYPTHDLGPIANCIDINHGNRILSLVSMASKARGLHEFIVQDKGVGYDAAGFDFIQGDVVTTIIKCAHGETITLTLDTSLPRAYSRDFHIQGTKGLYEENNRSIYLDSMHISEEEDWKDHWDNIEEFREYDHPIWKEYLKDGIKGGHSGIDYLEMITWINACLKGISAPVDVYDAATWMAVSTLTEQSIAMGGMPVAMPDFTSGKWMTRPRWQPYVAD